MDQDRIQEFLKDSLFTMAISTNSLGFYCIAFEQIDKN